MGDRVKHYLPVANEIPPLLLLPYLYDQVEQSASRRVTNTRPRTIDPRRVGALLVVGLAFRLNAPKLLVQRSACRHTAPYLARRAVGQCCGLAGCSANVQAS